MNIQNNNDRPFIRGAIAIESMRDNGYKNAAYALAELIDNSIQAGAKNVKLLCFEKSESTGSRTTRRIKHIGIFDTGKGMSKDVLHLALEFGGSKHRDDPSGMGKFGMGLPNSSISQCKRVDVWSWEKGAKPCHTYLDIDMMKSGELESIPYPIEKELPKEYLSLIQGDKVPESGTFILWSRLDRLQWKTSASIYKHSEMLVGRMYRKFIAVGDVDIYFEPYLWNDALNKYLPADKPAAAKFRANDPLYLSANTSLPDLPAPMTGEVPFEIKQREIIEIPFEGEIHTVEIIVSMIKHETANAIKHAPGIKGSKLGGTEWGAHMAANIGVSIVRAGRELETRTDFLSKSLIQTKSRFMGVEVNFPPGLDKIFGVLNNKQAAVNFENMSIDSDAEKQGFLNAEEYQQDLEDNNDPKLKLYHVSSKVSKAVKEVEKLVETLNVDVTGPKNSNIVARPKAEIILEALNTKRSEAGKGPVPDQKIKLADKPDIIKAIKRDISVTEPEAQNIVERIIENNEHFKLQEISVAQNIFFDVSRFDGFTLLQLNKNHPFYEQLIQSADEKQRNLLKVCLGAWARMENEALSERSVKQLQFARELWGQMLHEYLSTEE
ncbi:ATP-binding protein [Aliivibrio fischeri]|uniref:ATP-binding protein n=1 Tax=Aliivibrio fischeri TaxID=668 RepID=UPI000AB37B80|nr:ATP-binding protein [Aliivibrio fischeri]